MLRNLVATVVLMAGKPQNTPKLAKTSLRLCNPSSPSSVILHFLLQPGVHLGLAMGSGLLQLLLSFLYPRFEPCLLLLQLCILGLCSICLTLLVVHCS
ncbi:hypothetical protein B0H14DRAFT_3526887 [Mycena olivaceomarginata]|nr:hypothetical protein B0H14DRAFT_3526887 [Mycena olivaceomarginata]